ncbi:hypothetical protein EXIGLDRAFT_575561, partial [Exidia glandulosa HHB12029]
DGKLKCLSVSKLRNRGVLFNLNSRAAADWLRRNRVAFTAEFDAAAIVRDRGYQLLVKNVPTDVDISAPETLRRIEEENELPTQTLLQAKWLKAVDRRRIGQQNAHLRLSVASPSLANKLIL